MTHPLDGAFRKLERAEEHIQELKEVTNRFLETNPYSYRLQEHPETLQKESLVLTPDTFRLLRIGPAIFDGVRDLEDGRLVLAVTSGEFSIIAEQHGAVPSHDWGVIVGDIAHNLRSALDQLVWELTNAYLATLKKPDQPTGDRKRIVFPITTDVKRWKDQAKEALWGVDPQLKRRFEELQPWYGGKNPELDVLWRLHELWNRDKHRQVHLVGGIYYLRGFGMRLSQGVVSFQQMSSHIGGPFQAEAELARYRVLRATLKNPAPDQPPVQMNLDPEFAIAFDSGPPGNGERVHPVLRDMHNKVSEILTEFRSHL